MSIEVMTIHLELEWNKIDQELMQMIAKK